MLHRSPVDGHSNVTEFDGWSSLGRGTAVPSRPRGMTIRCAGGSWSVATRRSPLRWPGSLRGVARRTRRGTGQCERSAIDHESQSDHRCRLPGARFGAATICIPPSCACLRLGLSPSAFGSLTGPRRRDGPIVGIAARASRRWRIQGKVRLQLRVLPNRADRGLHRQACNGCLLQIV